MGALRQLGALFWKNFLIRKRHPTFLVLEVLWPVVLFVALALMRLGFPPDHRETCEYPERAVPSAGLVPFLQSSICTLNNNCSTRSWIQERAESQQRFQAMIRDIDPLLNKDTTIDAFKALPTVNIVLTAVKDVANGTAIDDIDDRLVLRNMVKDPAAVVDILSDKYNILERKVAESLLDASVNPLALVNSIGTVDFKGIVCDPDKLEQYIILSDKSNRYIVNKYSVSNSLCRIDDDKISDITNDLVRQLDVANIIRLIQDLSNVTGSIDYAVLLEDIADLVDMYMDKSSLLSMINDFDLTAVPNVLRSFGKLVPMLNDLSAIDFESLGSLFDMVTPLLRSFIDDSASVDIIEEALKSASDSLSSLNGDMDLEQMMEELPKLMNTTELLKGLGLPTSLINMPMNELNNLISLFTGEKALEDMSLNETMEYIENMLPEVLGNDTADMIMAMATNMMEMVDDIRVHYDKMETDLKYAVTNTDAVTVALNTLDEAGPEMTYIFMSEVVTMENIYTLMSGETTVADVCRDAVNVTYHWYKGVPGRDPDVVVQTICSDEATQAIGQVFVDNSMSKLTGQLEKEMEDMDSIMKGTIPADQEIAKMKDMYYEVMDVINELMATTDEDPEEWTAVLAKTNMDYAGSYNWVWNNIGSQYTVQTITMLPVVIAKSAENSPMWESAFKPWFETVDAILHSAMKRVKWFEAMNEEDKIITKVVKYLPYYPYIFESAVGQNLSELARVLSLNETTELSKMLCEETQWDSLNISANISIDDMRQFVCKLNITKFVEDVWNIADPTAFMADVELEVEANLENGIQWARMAGDLHYLLQTLDGKNSVQDLLSTVFQSDLSMIYSYYTVMMDSLAKLTIGSLTSDMENTSDIETSLKSLDEALVSWDLWKRVKHYIRTWNLLAKILNEYAELTQDPNWGITEYFNKLSPTLGKYLKNSTDTMPEVVDALQNAANNPQQLVERMSNIDYMGFCDDPRSLSSLLGVENTPSFTKFQDGLCQLNWTKVMEEMEVSNTPWREFMPQIEMISTYDTVSLPPITLNWTDVISTTRKFLDYVNKGMFDNFVPDLSNFGLTGTDSSVSNLTSALQNTWEYDVEQIGKSVDQLMKLLFDMSPENDTFIEMWQYTVAMQSYINYHFFKFVNIHLDIINRTKTFNLRAHLNSARADKLFDLMEKSPEVNTVLLYNMRLLSAGSNTEQWLSLDYNNLCMDTTKLEAAIKMPDNSNISKSEVIDAICAAVGEELFNEVLEGMEGLEEFINAFENIVSMNMTASELLVDYSKIAKETERYGELLAAVTMMDIKVESLPLTRDGEIDRLMEQFSNFPAELAENYDMTDPLKALQSSQNQTLQSLMQLQDIPGATDIMRISEMYMRVLTAMMIKSEAMLLDPVTGFQGYPEMYKMWQMMEWLPQLYATFTYTSFVDNSKISTFTEALIMGTDELCKKDPYDLMTNPPILNIKFEDFFNLFCSVNFTLLEHEAMEFIENKDISDTYDSLSNTTGKVDVNGWMAEYDRLMKQTEAFFNKTGQFHTPGFDNMTLWEEVMKFLDETTNNLDTLTMATQNMDGILDSLSSMSPDFQDQLKAMEITYYVMERMLDHLENMTGDSYKLEEFFHGYGQMQRLVVMLQEPGVMATLMASINTPKFAPLLQNTNATAVIIDICDSNITKYMTIPPRVTANMTDVKERFCKIDFDILMEEFVDAFFIKDIMDMMSANTTIDWTTITKQNSEITERLGKWLENPPELDLPADWENSTFWFELLDLLNGDQAVQDGDPSLETLLKGMEGFLGEQYADVVKSITPLALQIMEMIELDSDAKRAFATIDLFLEYMVDRMMEVSDNFTVDTLSKNSSEIIRFMNALADLRNMSNSDYEELNRTIDQEKLYNLLLDPNKLMDMCENDNVAAYISANGIASKASIALEEVICIDTETWSQVLQDQAKVEMFEEKLAEIWNASNSNAHLNWTSLSSNMEKFVEMLVDWMQMPPEASDPLQQWTDWDGILSFFTSLYKDPRMLMSLLNNVNPLFGTEMNNLTNAFNQLLMPFIQQLQSDDIEEIFNNPEKIGTLIESMVSIEDWLTVLQRFFEAYYAPDAQPPTRENILNALVCDDHGELTSYLNKYLEGMITGQSGYIWHLCMVNQSEWDNTLRSYFYTEEDLEYVHKMFDQAVADKMAEHDDKNAIKDLMEMFRKLNLEGLLNSTSTEDWLQSSQNAGLEELMAVLEMIGEKELLTEFKRTLLVITEVQEYIKMMLEKLTGNESIPITDVLPSSIAMASFIESLGNSDTVSFFTLAYINPAKFFSLMFSNDWEDTICDMELFSETFEFPSDVNVTSVQQSLCSEYASQKTYLDDIMKAVDMEKMVKSIEQILMNDTVKANNETWAYMSSLVDSITRSLLDIGNSNITGFEDWIEPVLRALENMGDNTQSDSYAATCDIVLESAKSSEMYTEWIKPYLDSIHSFVMISYSVMNVQIGVDEAVCQMKTKNITQIIQHLEEVGVPGELKKIEEIMSQRAETEFTCASYSSYNSFFNTLATSLTKVFDGSSNLGECISDTLEQSEELLEDISKLFSAASEAMELLENKEVRELLDNLMGSNGSSELIDTILQLYNQQEDAVKQLQENLEQNMTDITSFLQKTISASTDSIFSSLNMTFLKNARNLTADELIEKLCDSGDLGTLDAALESSLCGEDKQLAKTVADNLVNYGETLEELEELAEYDSTSFWSKISADISALVGNIEGLTSLTSLVDRLGKVDISTLGQDRELLRTLQELLVDNGPDAILENLNTLLDDFKILDDSNITNAILDDVRMLADGVFAFTSLRDMFKANSDVIHRLNYNRQTFHAYYATLTYYFVDVDRNESEARNDNSVKEIDTFMHSQFKIKDLVKDTAYLRDYMINTMMLPENVTDAIIDGSLSIDTLVSAATADISGWICDSKKLEELINITDDSIVDVELVSKQFCSLDEDTVKSLLDEIFQQLDIGQLMEDLVVNGINGILRKSNISLEETKAAVKSLVDANDDLQKITKTFNEFAETIPDAFTTLAQAQTGDQEFGSLSAILCGNSIPMIGDEFNTGAAFEDKKELTEEQQTEVNALPGNACKDMYVRIMEDRNGPIIWSYLKPLLRGKIVYSPNTPEAKRIVTQINTTFSSLEEFIDLAVDWAEGSVALGDLTGDKAKELQDLLSSNVIKSMLTEVSGVDTSDLDDILYTLEDTDMDMMEGISKVAKMIKDYISCLQLDRFEGYDTENEMEKEAAILAADNELLAGIVFEMPSGSMRKKRQADTSIPTHVHYKIRMDVDNTPDTEIIKNKMWRPQPYDDFFTELRYFRGFTQLQDMIDEAIIALHVGENVTLPSVTTNQFPYPCHTQDLFVNTIAGYLLNVLMTLSWLAGISVAVYNLVYDRERGQEETLNAMGMKGGLNWIAWFFSTMLVMAIVALVDVLILRYGNIFMKSNMAIIYLYFLVFIFSTIMMCYFVSAFFTRTSLAILACIIVYVVSYLPFVVLYTVEVQMEFWHKTLVCLASTSAFSYAAQYIARYEEQQVGLNWDNIRDDPMYGDGFSFSWCCIMILIDGCIYFILGWYVRNVKPGKFGVAEPWYFIFNPSSWCGRSTDQEGRYKPQNEDVFAEEVQSNTPVVLSARGLSKTYSDGTVAVKDLSLDIHCGNVTTLLGHNGAAKTTTMNMLIGILQPSKGAVRILNQPLKRMRGSLGICSQHNALYEYMTVKEHMEFYSSMKGGSLHGLSAKDEIRQLLKDVDLYYCRNMLVKNLSGGMQRRLCVALAFVGGSKAVILDEPTSGVDPSGRRAVWNLIIRRKAGTAVLLSTHHLDEADIISDQIAIMHEGSLLCQGSPMFLKKHLASGHRLTVVKESSDVDPVPVLTMLKRWLPGAALQSTAGAEMTFVLPTVKDADFYGLFQDLESQKQALGIVSYGISDPHLEEVFMKVCSAADIGRKITPATLRHIEEEETAAANGDSKDEWKHDFESSASGGSRTKLSKTTSGSGGGIVALLTKRFHHYRRDWRIVITTLILPLLLFLLASGLYKVKPDATSSPSRYLSPAMYGPDAYVFMQQNSTRFSIGDKVLGTYMVDPGIGTSCMDGMNLGDPFKCVSPATKFSIPSHNTSADGRCFCENEAYKCEGSPYGVPPEQRVTTTTDILQNLKNRDINTYLLNSYPEFIQKRYGGWSFEDESSDANANLKAKIWYDNGGFHALPSFYNAYSNGLLRALVNDDTEAPKYGISTYNHPFMFGRERLSKFSIMQHAADMGIAVIILLAFTFIPVGVLLYSVNENVRKEKHMQFISGVSSFTYWISSLIWDLLILGVAVGVSVIILLIFKPSSFWERSNLEATVCLLALYGWATITFAYLLVKRFRNAGTAFFTVFCTILFLGIFCILMVFSFNYFQSDSDNESMKDAYKAMRYIFLVFPPYALGGGLLDLIDNQIRTTIYMRFNTDVYEDPFTFDMIGWHMFAMGVEGFVFLVLTIWMDTRFCCSRKYERSVKESKDDDSDVTAEKMRIDSGDCRTDAVIVRNLHKIYRDSSKEVHAVNGLSFGVPAGQCFGLLGVNGAGKTSTFNVLTGVADASYGHCYILGQRIEPGSSTVGQNMGYCPQDDALDPYLSITNTLYFHAKLKGIDGSARKEAVDKVMGKLDLHKIKNKIVKSCSGGMKRKLSLAVALLGDPAVVLLDEPTSGMDPKAKRLVWNCLLEAKRNGQAIILTSHSLEECDILCDRIGIMVNGEFKCLGTSQHLKVKYGDGYTVTLYVSGLSDSMSKLNDLIHQYFPRAGVTDQHVNVVQLDVPSDSVNIADMFGILEREKANFNILYYTVSQTTLDTIFLNFAREQTDGATVDASDANSTSSARGSYDGSSQSGGPFSNPSYGYIKPTLTEDKLKGRSSVAYDNPYSLPPKNTFSDEDSYSTHM